MSDDADRSTITLSVEEYNRLKAQNGQILKLEKDLEIYKTENLNLSGQLEEAKKKTTIKGPNREEIEAEIRKELGEKLSALENDKTAIERKYKNVVVVDKVINALMGEGLHKWAPQYLRNKIEQECDLEGDEVVIKDERGNARWSSETPDKKMTIAEYAKMFKNVSPEMFESTVKDGTGDSLNAKPKAKQISLEEYASMPDSERRKVPAEIVDSLLANTRLL